MEIEYDLDTIRRVIAEEYAQARREIAEVGVAQAYERSRLRHDEHLARAPDAPTLACRSGCSWCCYFTVDVRAVEVFAILRALAALPAADQQRIRSEIAANSALIQTLTEDERAQRNIKCPFLAAGRCSIYAARPQTCRNYHATDAAGCQQTFENPGDLEIDPEFAPLVYQSGGSHVDGFARALQETGFEIGVYEMSSALQAALNEPEAEQRFAAKRTPFATLECYPVPLEFVDIATETEE
jgi:Fe-S-cluster containining protein